MDMRSFHLNFEVNAFLFRTKSTTKLVEDYKKKILNVQIKLILKNLNNVRCLFELWNHYLDFFHQCYKVTGVDQICSLLKINMERSGGV